MILESSHQIDRPPRRDLGDRVRLGRDVISSVFDDDTDAWRLTTRRRRDVSQPSRHRDLRFGHVPWIPNLPGRNDFRGISFHGQHPTLILTRLASTSR